MRIKIKESDNLVYDKFKTYKYNEALKNNAGKWIEVETEYLFDDQYNTTIGRIFDRDIQAVENDARKGLAKCSYCGEVFKYFKSCPKGHEEEFKKRLWTFDEKKEAASLFFIDRGYDLYGKPVKTIEEYQKEIEALQKLIEGLVLRNERIKFLEIKKDIDENVEAFIARNSALIYMWSFTDNIQMDQAYKIQDETFFDFLSLDTKDKKRVVDSALSKIELFKMNSGEFIRVEDPAWREQFDAGLDIFTERGIFRWCGTQEETGYEEIGGMIFCDKTNILRWTLEYLFENHRDKLVKYFFEDAVGDEEWLDEFYLGGR